MSDVLAAELARQIAGLLCFGTIAAVDAAQARVQVQVGEAVTDWLPWGERLGGPKDSTVPTAGEQVLLAAPSGDRRQAVVLCTIRRLGEGQPNLGTKRSTTFPDGAVVEYDWASHQLQVLLPTGASLTVIGDVVVTGNLLVSGNVSDGTGTLAQERLRFAAHTHVAPGGLTGPPQA